VACLAQLGFASELRSFTYSRERCEEAIALAEEHGWGTASILAPALETRACSMVWTGDFDGADRQLRRAEQALRLDSGSNCQDLWISWAAAWFRGATSARCPATGWRK
jgi:LuxR family maltose regulon positive regulatory protein